MLKYEHIIRRLSDKDKIRILSDIHSLSDKEYRALGIPAVKMGLLREYCGDEYPSPVSLANSWDPRLVASVADAVTKKMADDGVNLAVMPSPKMKVNPYRAALSEDPLLASSMAAEYLKAAKRRGLAACVSDFRLTADEIEWMDCTPDERFIDRYIVEPYSRTAAEGDCAAIFTESELADPEYSSVNAQLTELVANKQIAPNAIAVVPKLSEKNTVSHLTCGGLTFEGSAFALESALSKYKQLKKAIGEGKATTEELNAEIACGRALTPTQLDEAVDRLLDFVHSIKHKPTVEGEIADEGLQKRAAARSVVLLKNAAGTLPFKKETKFCIIGDTALVDDAFIQECAAGLCDSGHVFTGHQRGYDLERDRSPELIVPAAALAECADVVLLFLGFGTTREKAVHRIKKLSLPANQLELLERLSACHAKIVAIMPGDHVPDIGMEELCSAILLAPTESRQCASVLAEVLTGKLNPSGRLASTAYLETDTCYRTHKTYRLRDGIKTGAFIGYRYYDTADFCPGYPFGHGLGYAQFAYSQLVVQEGTVTVTVRNTGKVTGIETVQVYIGIESSAVVRPFKELVAFEQVELEPGEKKTVTLPLTLPDVYDRASGCLIVEKGVYTVSVGASVRDIRLVGTLYAGKETLQPDGERLCEYIQSESNIITDDYKLEAKFDPMKKSAFNFIAGAVTLVMALGLKLYCALADVGSIFLDLFCLALGIVGIVFFIREAVLRNRAYSEERRKLDRINAERFEDAVHVPVYAADSMFAKEFDVAQEDSTGNTEVHSEVVDSEYLSYIDKEQTFELAVRDFVLYASERGTRFEESTVKNIFASMASSRLLLVSGMDQRGFRTFMHLLCGYFETSMYIEQAGDSCKSEDQLLFRNDATGNRARTDFFSALEAARGDRHSIHFAALTDVRYADLPRYFTHFVNYAKNPHSHYQFNILNESHVETTYLMPSNVWFVLHAASNETIDRLPGFVSEIATFNTIRFTDCQTAAHQSLYRKFSYHQMDYLVEKMTSVGEIEEDTWKKIDRLEAFVNAHAPYHIGNKMWLCLERYAYVYLACGGEAVSAIDEAVRAKLLPSMIAVLCGNLDRDEKGLAETIEWIFGEGHADGCLKLIKACGADIA